MIKMECRKIYYLNYFLLAILSILKLIDLFVSLYAFGITDYFYEWNPVSRLFLGNPLIIFVLTNIIVVFGVFFNFFLKNSNEYIKCLNIAIIFSIILISFILINNFINFFYWDVYMIKGV